MAKPSVAKNEKEKAPFLKVVSSDTPLIEDIPNEELMLQHGQGSEEAFTELLKRHQKGVLNYVYRMIQNRHVAEEITQDVFLALIKNGQRYQPTAKFTTYLYTIASNMVSKEWMKRKRRPKVFSILAGFGNQDDDTYNPLNQISDKKADTVAQYKKGEISRAINDALKHLPEHQREAFILRRFQDLSYLEIAEITGVPIGTAKSRVVRAERGLRPHLESYREYVSQ